MKRYHIVLLTVLIGLAVLLSSCVPGPRVTGSPGITLSEEMVYVAYSNFVYGLNIEDGAVKWHYPDERSNKIVFYAPPLYEDDQIYVGDLANNFYKLDAANGNVEWTFSDAKGFYIGQAEKDDGMIFAPSNDGTLYVLNDDGDLLWQYETGHYIWAQPQVSSDAVYVASMDHFVYALTKDGEEIWAKELSGAVVSSPVLSDDESALFVGTMGKEMVSLDTKNGDILWSFDAGGGLDSVWAQAVLLDGMLIFADSSGQLYALDSNTGEPEWQNDTSSSVVGGLAAIEDGFVLSTQDGLVKAYSADGTPGWEATLVGELYQAPVVYNETLVAGSIDGENLVYGFNLSGVQLWSTTPEN